MPATTPVKNDFTGSTVTEGGFRTAFNNLIDWLLEKVYVTDGAKYDVVVSNSGTKWKVREQKDTMSINATTMDIWSMPKLIAVSGTALSITDVADSPEAGDSRILILPVGTILVHSTTFKVQGNSNYTIETDDLVSIRAITASTFAITIFRQNLAGNIGELFDWPMSTPPEHGLVRNGASYSSTLYAKLFEKLVKQATVTLTDGAQGTVNWTAHGRVVNDKVKFTTTGALLTGLVAGTDYYVVSSGLAENSFCLSATIGGAPIAFTGSQSGVHKAIHAPYGCANDLSTFNVPNAPADYADVQANSNVGSQTVGENLAHSHPGVVGSAAIGNVPAGGSTVVPSGNQGIGSFGGAANLAAGVRVLKCIRFK